MPRMRKRGFLAGTDVSFVRLSRGDAAECSRVNLNSRRERAARRSPIVVVELLLALFFCWLIIPPIIAWLRRASIVLRIYRGRVTVEQGVINKCYREFLARDIRSVDIDQGFLARLVGIGDLTIATAATVDAAECIAGIPNPHAVREQILAQRSNP